MILNGKCKEMFLEWYWSDWFEDKERNHYEEKEVAVKALYTTDKLFLNALIIEFFDSVGIYILPKRFTHCLEFQDWYFIITNKQGVHLNNYLEGRIKNDSRQEATIQAIIKANNIYNDTDKV